MKEIIIGEADFSEIILNNAIYVDKTRELKSLLDSSKYYFFSRPRRFGKSLLCSTLQYLFQGRKALFEGLWIHDQQDWSKTNPVLFFSFVRVAYKESGLHDALCRTLDALATEQRLALQSQTPTEKFRELIEKMSAGGQVVVLIDEYDKPIIDYLNDTAVAAANRELLKGFYGILKDTSLMARLRLVFITGVSKFSRVSLFSDLNHLSDISMHKDYATLTGITQTELEAHFSPYIDRLAKEEELSREALLAKMKRWYNGYSWDGVHFVYNPFSLLRFFDARRFDNYWFDSATPTMLVNAIRDSRQPVEDFEQLSVDDSFFKKFDIEDIDLKVLMFQTGYLTVKSVEKFEEETIYHLAYPNEEVHKSFVRHLLESYTRKNTSSTSEMMVKIKRALYNKDVATFIFQIKAMFADISYQMLPREQEDAEKVAELWEGYFQFMIYLLLSLIGVNIQTEISKHKGRMDAAIQTDRFIYILEFKIGTAAEGMEQIVRQEYALYYQTTGKPITLIAIGFDKKNRNVKDWEIAEL